MSGAHERDRDPLGIRIRTRLGRRGASLAFFALVDVVFSYFLARMPADAAKSGSYPFLATIAPLWVWAIPWALSGLLCVLYAPRMMPEDRVAFAAASAVCVGWSVIHLAGWVVGEIPRGFVAAVVWGGFAAFIQVIAGWTEPPRGQ